MSASPKSIIPKHEASSSPPVSVAASATVRVLRVPDKLVTTDRGHAAKAAGEIKYLLPVCHVSAASTGFNRRSDRWIDMFCSSAASGGRDVLKFNGGRNFRSDMASSNISIKMKAQCTRISSKAEGEEDEIFVAAAIGGHQ
jgi:hypothetical protein